MADYPGQIRPVTLILILLLLSLTPIVSIRAEDGGWDWSGQAGLQYDLISNDYYLRTVDTLGLTPDSLLELKSMTDRIDERGGFVRFDLSNKSPLDLRLSNRLYLTNSKVRATVGLGAGWGAFQLSTNTEFKSYNDTLDFSLYKSQFRNSSRLSVELFSGERNSLELSQEMEYLGYQQSDPTITGYYQSESRVRYSQRLGQFADLDLTLRLDVRNSYDSSELNFTRMVGDFDFDKVSASGYLSTALYFERRDYAAPGAKDDYFYVSPTFTLDQSLSDQLSIAPKAEFHLYRYSEENFVTFSNRRFVVELKLNYHYQLLSTFSIGIGGERFRAIDGEYSSQDYRALNLIVGYETYASKRLTLSFDSRLGRRKYSSTDNEFYTDYNFVQFDLLADLLLLQGLRLSVIGGTDYEYHSSKESDSFVHMLSTTLTYEIK